jgi:hypothetical protein
MSDDPQSAVSSVPGAAEPAASAGERTCEQGCNGCDECTDYDQLEDD